MRKLLLLIATVAMLLPSCKKINEALDSLDGRLDKLEQESIPSIDEQISAINTTFNNLDTMDKKLKGYIDALTATANNLQEQINTTNTKIDEVEEALKNEISSAKTEVLSQLATAKAELEAELVKINNTIASLQEKDKELNNKITELRSYVDNELTSTENWVNATFATLEQYNALVSEIATIKEQIKAINQSITELETRLNAKIATDIATAVSNLNADIQQKVKDITDAYTSAIKGAKEEITSAYTTAIQNAITALDSALKTWVGEQLSGYYTIAEIDAKITALQNSIKDGDDALLAQLNLLKESLQTMKTEITEAYKKAIADAINTNNGVIDTKIANEIATVNQRITSEVATINAKITEIENRLNNIEAKLEDLLARIQSISYIPTYEDGKATVKYADGVSSVTLDFEISPKDAVAELAKVWQQAISVKAIYTQTRAVSFVDMPIMGFEVDVTNGVISVTASGENLSDDFFNGVRTASARLAISDGNNSVTSEYIPMVAKQVSAEEMGSIPTNEIWYTSVDGNIVIPSNTSSFDADIVSNTYKDGIGVIKFDREITVIDNTAFYENESIVSIIIPNGVTSIGRYAFTGCDNLTNVSLPKNLITIGERAFYFCLKLTDVKIPDSVTTIKNGAFLQCESFTKTHVPNNVVTIEESAFSCCTKLKQFSGKFATGEGLCLITGTTLNSFAAGASASSYIIPDYITNIGDFAFMGAQSLTNVTFGDKVERIGWHAFCNCYGLESVMLPSSIKTIEVRAFIGCNNLKEVYCKSTTPPMGGSNMFSYNNLLGRKIYVPRNSVEAYKSAEGWKEYAYYIVGYDF